MIHNCIIFATNIVMIGLSISISNDITGRKDDSGSAPPSDTKFWVDNFSNNIITDSADKLIFKLA